VTPSRTIQCRTAFSHREFDEVAAMFVPGREYRREDIHRLVGGQRQSGIVTPRGSRVVLLFSSPRGGDYGYGDGWSEDGRFYRYSGEGQHGDMTFTRGNRAILEHREKGRELHLFELVRPGVYRYVGQMEYAGYELCPGVPDRNNRPRTAIVFYLRPIAP
jgi:5-methylcytosine-specific restriction protein A